MSWETMALIALVALCLAIAVWGFKGDRSGRDARFLRLFYLDGSGYLDVPARGGAGRWHRGRHWAA